MYDLKFTVADLETNREGRLTKDQLERLRKLLIWQKRGIQHLLLMSLLFVLLIVVAVFMLYPQIPKVTVIALVFIPAIPVLLIFAAIYLFFTLQSRYIGTGTKREIVRSVEGYISLKWGNTYGCGTGRYYRLLVQRNGLRGLNFDLPNAAALNYFREGEIYRVYFVGPFPSHIVLSVEHIRGN